MQERDSKPASSITSQVPPLPLASPIVTKVRRSGAAEKPSEAILTGIEKHISEFMPIV